MHGPSKMLTRHQFIFNNSSYQKISLLAGPNLCWSDEIESGLQNSWNESHDSPWRPCPPFHTIYTPHRFHALFFTHLFYLFTFYIYIITQTHSNSPSLTLVLPLFSLPIAPLSLSNSFIEPTSRHHLPLPLISLFCHPFQACMDISASHQPLHTHIRMYSLFIPPISTHPISPLCVKSLMRTSSHHLFPLYTTIIPTNAPSRISYSPHLSKLHAHSFPSPSSSYLSYHKLITINLSHAVHQAPTSAPSLHFRLYPWSWFVPSFPLVHLETMATI